jgi:hypothetical protein
MGTFDKEGVVAFVLLTVSILKTKISKVDN